MTALQLHRKSEKPVYINRDNGKGTGLRTRSKKSVVGVVIRGSDFMMVIAPLRWPFTMLELPL